MSKQFIAILIACLIGLFGIFTLTNKDEGGSDDGNNNTNKSALSNNVIGDNAKKVSLVEYGDFQCPACGAYHPVVKQVVEKYSNDIQFQFRNYPIQSAHPNARAAARAAEAAGKQKKYWEMHDLLFEQQNSWSGSSSVNPIFETYATQLKLDIPKFKADFASSEINAIINADFAEGNKLGVNSTPTFYLQGKKVEEAPRDLDGFSKLIDQAIKDAEKN